MQSCMLMYYFSSSVRSGTNGTQFRFHIYDYLIRPSLPPGVIFATIIAIQVQFKVFSNTIHTCRFSFELPHKYMYRYARTQCMLLCTLIYQTLAAKPWHVIPMRNHLLVPIPAYVILIRFFSIYLSRYAPPLILAMKITNLRVSVYA